MKQQSSLFSFFGKGKKKRPRAPSVDEDDTNNNDDRDDQGDQGVNDDASRSRGSSSSSSPSPTRPPPPAFRKRTGKTTSDDRERRTRRDDDDDVAFACAVTPRGDDHDGVGNNRGDDTPVESSNRQEKEDEAEIASPPPVVRRDDADGIPPEGSHFRTTKEQADDETAKRKMRDASPLSPVTDATSGTAGASEEESGDEEEEKGNSDSDGERGGVANGNADGKSAYELLRERNIARNEARLRALGLLASGVAVGGDRGRRRNEREDSGRKATGRTRKRKKASAAAAATASLPARRSSRLRNPSSASSATEGGILASHEDVKLSSRKDARNENANATTETEEEFTVSPLIEYRMTRNDDAERRIDAKENLTGGFNPRDDAAQAAGDTGDGSARIGALAPSGPRLAPPSGLTAIYSLQWFRSDNHRADGGSAWLVGAGKSGLVALWDASRTNDAEEEKTENCIEPVLSWKGHGGRWIADARFAPSAAGSPSSGDPANDGAAPGRLLTAGNDGTACLWDLTSASLATGAPRLVARSGKSLHSSGIFSMDLRGGRVVTGSKDRTIAVTALDDGLDGPPSWRSDFHGAKVGSVSFSSCDRNPLIVSASDDGTAAVHDVRGARPAAMLEQAHARPHSAVWMPRSDSVFLTAGLDEVIKLWDLRNTSRPVRSYHGHVPGNGGRRLKRIHRPTFFNAASPASSSDSFILSGGEGSRAISMFRLGGIPGSAVAGHESNGNEGGVESGLQSVFSRGKLPPDVGDIGSLAVNGEDVAVAVEGGEVLMLSPKARLRV